LSGAVTSGNPISGGVLTFTDGSTQDIASNEFTLISGTSYTFSIDGDFDDGIFTLTVTDNANPANSDTKSIGRMEVGVLALLSLVYDEVFDPFLLAKIEATKFHLMNGNGTAARDVYYGVQNSYADCVDSSVEPTLSGISVWVIDSDFEVQ
jgi:hypothetical protein